MREACVINVIYGILCDEYDTQFYPNKYLMKRVLAFMRFAPCKTFTRMQILCEMNRLTSIKYRQDHRYQNGFSNALLSHPVVIWSTQHANTYVPWVADTQLAHRCKWTRSIHFMYIHSFAIAFCHFSFTYSQYSLS